LDFSFSHLGIGWGEYKYLGTNETNINTHPIMKTLLVLRKLEISITVISAAHLTPILLDYYAGRRVLLVLISGIQRFKK
jgi:hypothetical protein